MKEKLLNVPVGKLRDDVHGVRAALDDESLADLAQSIGRIGVRCPLDVYNDGDVFVVVSGHRRLAAAKRAGLSVVPCIVRKTSVSQAPEAALAENLMRADLSPIEVAAAVADAVATGVGTIEEIGRWMHRTEHWVAAQVAMLKWPEDVIAAVHQKRIAVSAASNLALITDDIYRGFLVRVAGEDGATARSTAAWLQAWRAQLPPEQAVLQEPVPAGEKIAPALPQAPCLCCGTVKRTDSMAMVMVCTGCIAMIRGAGAGPAG